jgi:hypothetical protein
MAVEEPGSGIVGAEADDGVALGRGEPGIAAHGNGWEAASAVGVTECGGVGMGVDDAFSEELVVLVLVAGVHSWSPGNDLNVVAVDVQRMGTGILESVSANFGEGGSQGLTIVIDNNFHELIRLQHFSIGMPSVNSV